MLSYVAYLLYRCVIFFNDAATTEIYTLSLHDALPICDLEAARDLIEEQHHLVERQPVLGAQPAGEVGAVQALHREVRHRRVGPRQLEHAHDVRRLEPRRDRHLAVEALEQRGARGRTRVEKLDRRGSAVAARRLV